MSQQPPPMPSKVEQVFRIVPYGRREPARLEPDEPPADLPFPRNFIPEPPRPSSDFPAASNIQTLLERMSCGSPMDELLMLPATSWDRNNVHWNYRLEQAKEKNRQDLAKQNDNLHLRYNEQYNEQICRQKDLEKEIKEFQHMIRNIDESLGETWANHKAVKLNLDTDSGKKFNESKREGDEYKRELDSLRNMVVELNLKDTKLDQDITELEKEKQRIQKEKAEDNAKLAAMIAETIIKRDAAPQAAPQGAPQPPKIEPLTRESDRMDIVHGDNPARLSYPANEPERGVFLHGPASENNSRPVITENSMVQGNYRAVDPGEIPWSSVFSFVTPASGTVSNQPIHVPQQSGNSQVAPWSSAFATPAGGTVSTKPVPPGHGQTFNLPLQENQGHSQRITGIYRAQESDFFLEDDEVHFESNAPITPIRKKVLVVPPPPSASDHSEIGMNGELDDIFEYPEDIDLAKKRKLQALTGQRKDIMPPKKILKQTKAMEKTPKQERGQQKKKEPAATPSAKPIYVAPKFVKDESGLSKYHENELVAVPPYAEPQKLYDIYKHNAENHKRVVCVGMKGVAYKGPQYILKHTRGQLENITMSTNSGQLFICFVNPIDAKDFFDFFNDAKNGPVAVSRLKMQVAWTTDAIRKMEDQIAELVVNGASRCLRIGKIGVDKTNEEVRKDMELESGKEHVLAVSVKRDGSRRRENHSLGGLAIVEFNSIEFAYYVKNEIEENHVMGYTGCTAEYSYDPCWKDPKDGKIRKMADVRSWPTP
ncbi:hypothetical protein RUND412_010175 [Rhizina undulata]